MTRLFAALLLMAGAASGVAAFARELAARTAGVEQGTCELTCRSRTGAGDMSTRVECTAHMDAKQCTATADHKNLNDAYPANFNCAARIVETCTEARD
jgi:hypothetical protein